MKRFYSKMVTFGFCLGLTLFMYAMFYGYSAVTSLIYAVGFCCANVPEGIIATLTLSLARSAKLMGKKNQNFLLVKNSESIEMLGLTSCLCVDKTGTLTTGKMTVSHLYYDSKIINAS